MKNTTRIGSVVVGLSSTSTQVHLAPWGEGESKEGGQGGLRGYRRETGGDMGGAWGGQVTEPAKCISVLI